MVVMLRLIRAHRIQVEGCPLPRMAEGCVSAPDDITTGTIAKASAEAGTIPSHTHDDYFEQACSDNECGMGRKLET